jgi:hypothetical protein
MARVQATMYTRIRPLVAALAEEAGDEMHAGGRHAVASEPSAARTASSKGVSGMGMAR